MSVEEAEATLAKAETALADHQLRLDELKVAFRDVLSEELPEIWADLLKQAVSQSHARINELGAEGVAELKAAVQALDAAEAADAAVESTPWRYRNEVTDDEAHVDRWGSRSSPRWNPTGTAARTAIAGLIDALEAFGVQHYSLSRIRGGPQFDRDPAEVNQRLSDSMSAFAADHADLGDLRRALAQARQDLSRARAEALFDEA